MTVSLCYAQAQYDPPKIQSSYSPQQAQKLVGPQSARVVRALSRFDMATLSRYAHPTKGVKFYPYLASDKPQKRTRKAVQCFLRDPKIYMWGHYDGTGDPIRLTSKAYYRKFIYDDNFSLAKEINFNTLKQRGNTVNLLPKKHPKAIFVEYYRPAKSAQGYDWNGLWLAWEKSGAQWYLVAIGHDEWTI